MISKKAWDEIPKDVQEKIKIACKASSAVNFPRFDYDSAIATKQFKAKKGQQVAEMEPAALIEIQKMSFKAFEKEAARNPPFAKVVYSQYKTKELLADWRDRQKNLNRIPADMLPNMELLRQEVEKSK